MEVSKDKLLKAKQRVAEIRQFYKHLMTYLLFNFAFMYLGNFYGVKIRIYADFIVSNKFTADGFEYYPLWFIWGVFLILDTIKVFVLPKFFGSRWEAKKIKELTEK